MKIYICPILMDLLAFFIVFAMTYGAGERGSGARECFWMGAVFPAAYMIASLLAGKLLDRKNSYMFLMISTILMVLAGLAGLMSTQLWQLIMSMLFIGICLGFFFNAFQSYMRGETPPGGLALTVARYTMAWSAGTSLGFILSGYLYSLGLIVMSVAAILTGACILAVIVLTPRRDIDAPSSEEHIEEGTQNARPVNPSYVVVGWIMLFTIMFVQRPVMTFFPLICAEEAVAPFMAALPLFAQFMIQGIAGYWMWRHRDALYRKKGIIVMHVMGVLVFIAIWFNPAYLLCLAGFSLIGIYAGFTYFSAVYYASNSGNRTSNIAINEFVVGLGCLAGVLSCEWWMTRSGSPSGMYVICALAIFISLLVQIAYAGKFKISPASTAVKIQEK